MLFPNIRHAIFHGQENLLYETLLAPKRPDSSAVTSSRSFLNAIPIDQMCVIFTRIITMIYFWSNYQKKKRLV